MIRSSLCHCGVIFSAFISFLSASMLCHYCTSVVKSGLCFQDYFQNHCLPSQSIWLWWHGLHCLPTCFRKQVFKSRRQSSYAQTKAVDSQHRVEDTQARVSSYVRRWAVQQDAGCIAQVYFFSHRFCLHTKAPCIHDALRRHADFYSRMCPVEVFVDMPNRRDPDAAGSAASTLFALAMNSWDSVSSNRSLDEGVFAAKLCANTERAQLKPNTGHLKVLRITVYTRQKKQFDICIFTTAINNQTIEDIWNIVPLIHFKEAHVHVA